MKHEWHVKRTTVGRSDGERRWDRVYQLLLEVANKRQEEGRDASWIVDHDPSLHGSRRRDRPGIRRSSSS